MGNSFDDRAAMNEAANQADAAKKASESATIVAQKEKKIAANNALAERERKNAEAYKK